VLPRAAAAARGRLADGGGRAGRRALGRLAGGEGREEGAIQVGGDRFFLEPVRWASAERMVYIEAGGAQNIILSTGFRIVQPYIYIY
jgi:hypothetical protein